MRIRAAKRYATPEAAWLAWFELFRAEHRGRVSEMRTDMRLAFMSGAAWGLEATLKAATQAGSPEACQQAVAALLEAMRWEGPFHSWRWDIHDEEQKLAKNTGFW